MGQDRRCAQAPRRRVAARGRRACRRRAVDLSARTVPSKLAIGCFSTVLLVVQATASHPMRPQRVLTLRSASPHLPAEDQSTWAASHPAGFPHGWRWARFLRSHRTDWLGVIVTSFAFLVRSWSRGPSSNGTELLGKSTSPPTRLAVLGTTKSQQRLSAPLRSLLES
jgi:hypothetical protein